MTLFRKGDWRSGGLLFLVAAVLLPIAKQSGWVHSLFGKAVNLLPARKALRAAREENKDLQGQLSAMKAQIEQSLPASSQSKQVEALHLITFDYLPASPLEHGWTQPYYKDGVAVFKTDLDIPGSLRMEIMHSVVAINYELPDIARLANTVQFTTKYAGGTQAMIFTKVEVGTRDGSMHRRLWIKYYYGERRATKTPDGPEVNPKKLLPESTVWLPAKLSADTLQFDINLPDAVALAVGEQGWVYKSVWDFRIRGTLSISPVTFGKYKQV